MSTNPFEDQSSKLSDEDQAEFDRLAADEQAEQQAQDNRADALLTDDERRDLRERGAADQETEARYPVENAAVRWDDAANGGDTSRGTVHTYSTPWGKRPMGEDEVADLRHQGVECTRVDDDAETSLAGEKSAMSHVVLAPKSDEF